MPIAVAGTAIEQNASVSKRKLSPSTNREHEQEPKSSGVVVVRALGGVPAHVHHGVDPGERARDSLAAQLTDGRDRASVRIRRDWDYDAGDRARLVRLHGRLAEDRTPARAPPRAGPARLPPPARRRLRRPRSRPVRSTQSGSSRSR